MHWHTGCPQTERPDTWRGDASAACPSGTASRSAGALAAWGGMPRASAQERERHVVGASRGHEACSATGSGRMPPAFPVGSALPAHPVCQLCASGAMNRPMRSFSVGLAIAAAMAAGACGGRATSGGHAASGGSAGTGTGGSAGTHSGGTGGTSPGGAGGSHSSGGAAGGGTAGTSGAGGTGGGGLFACVGSICYGSGSGGTGGSGCHNHTLWCDSATEYCSRSTAGIGGGVNAGCQTLPPSCATDHSCACFPSNSPCWCSEADGGIGLTVECDYP